MNSITLTSESSILQFKKRAVERLISIKMDGSEGTVTEYAERNIKEFCELLDFSLMQPKLNIHVNVSEFMFRLVIHGEL